MSDLTGLPQHDLPFFLAQNTGFAAVRPEDDLLHPQSFKEVADDSATETQYFGFSIPGEKIHALAYLWHHPNLKVVSGGIFVFQGIKSAPPEAELCDYRSFMSDSVLKNDLHGYRLANGYGVEILEKLKRFRLTYADPSRDNSVDVIFEAVQPVVMFADGNHFEQTMSVTGTLVLRGKRYAVETFSIRDRSWGKARPETLMAAPPNSWMIGTYGKDFAFNCNTFDQARNNPRLQGALALPDDRCLNGGWVFRHGRLGRIVRADKRVVREGALQASKAIELRLLDDLGRSFDMRGSLLAACPFPAWINMWAVVNSIRWECDGEIGHGDNQEAFWNDYLNST